jgi:glutathione synthase/RimK-type ligase-like ATP-grasp enzyme
VLQEYVAGSDVRVHTVGQRAFATEMISERVDYRFDAVAQYRSAVVDPEIAERCCATAAAEGLLLAGFDFRVATDGGWHCLEMNPVPSFLPYEMCSGEPIGDAVLDLFVTPMPHLGRSKGLRADEDPSPDPQRPTAADA